MLGTQRKGRVDALVSALGATGGAKLLAKLSMYTALFNANNRDALAKLRLSADLADGVLGKPPAPKGGGSTEARDAEVRAFLAANGGDPEKWTPDAWGSLPPALATSMLKDRMVNRRFGATMAFNKEKWAATLANIKADNDRADAAFAAGRADEGRRIARDASAAADQAVQEFLQEHNGMLKTQKVTVMDPNTGALKEDTVSVVDTSVLSPEAQTAYNDLIQARAALRKKVMGEPAPVVPGAPAPTTQGPPPEKKYQIGGLIFPKPAEAMSDEELTSAMTIAVKMDPVAADALRKERERRLNRK